MRNLDSVFRALADEKRRYTISCLQKHHRVSLADLAEFVAEKESERDITTISDETTRDVYFSLYHNHIPRLEDADLVYYEQETDVVARTENTQPSLRRVCDSTNAMLQDA